mmetsp:Transcript_75469/g.124577  ORF Transcript_75469/g.124577 Transcript_75469/m.124577 type:complete len:243 (-) Transcript_75469:701-1429(-)
MRQDSPFCSRRSSLSRSRHSNMGMWSIDPSGKSQLLVPQSSRLESLRGPPAPASLELCGDSVVVAVLRATVQLRVPEEKPYRLLLRCVSLRNQHFAAKSSTPQVHQEQFGTWLQAVEQWSMLSQLNLSVWLQFSCQQPSLAPKGLRSSNSASPRSKPFTTTLRLTHSGQERILFGPSFDLDAPQKSSSSSHSSSKDGVKGFKFKGLKVIFCRFKLRFNFNGAVIRASLPESVKLPIFLKFFK